MKSNQSALPACSIGDWLKFARCKTGIGQVDAELTLCLHVIMAHVMGQSRSWVLAHPEFILTLAQQEKLYHLLDLYMNGMPLPYIVGHQEFFGLKFEVTPDVLIPRPETELLVEQAIEKLKIHLEPRRVADVGTGSGCIAISLAINVPGLTCLAIDRSHKALQVAQRNAASHFVSDQITFIQSNLLLAFAGPFDLVCANLPYIPTTDVTNLPIARFEPHQALDGGKDGLFFFRALLEDSRRWLAPGGSILLEMQYDQGNAIFEIAKTYLPDALITIRSDLANLPRLVEINTIRTG